MDINKNLLFLIVLLLFYLNSQENNKEAQNICDWLDDEPESFSMWELKDYEPGVYLWRDDIWLPAIDIELFKNKPTKPVEWECIPRQVVARGFSNKDESKTEVHSVLRNLIPSIEDEFTSEAIPQIQKVYHWIQSLPKPEMIYTEVWGLEVPTELLRGKIISHTMSEKSLFRLMKSKEVETILANRIFSPDLYTRSIESNHRQYDKSKYFFAFSPIIQQGKQIILPFHLYGGDLYQETEESYHLRYINITSQVKLSSDQIHILAICPTSEDHHLILCVRCQIPEWKPSQHAIDYLNPKLRRTFQQKIKLEKPTISRREFAQLLEQQSIQYKISSEISSEELDYEVYLLGKNWTIGKVLELLFDDYGYQSGSLILGDGDISQSKVIAYDVRDLATQDWEESYRAEIFHNVDNLSLHTAHSESYDWSVEGTRHFLILAHYPNFHCIVDKVFTKQREYLKKQCNRVVELYTGKPHMQSIPKFLVTQMPNITSWIKSGEIIFSKPHTYPQHLSGDIFNLDAYIEDMGFLWYGGEVFNQLECRIDTWEKSQGKEYSFLLRHEQREYNLNGILKETMKKIATLGDSELWLNITSERRK